MQRRSFLGLAGLSTAAFVLRPGRTLAGRTARRPNIVYILADDLGYGHLGCYGQKEIKTPAIDKMAREGMRFTDHYAALCAPSRCVLMTGLHTGHCFIRNNKALPVEGNVPIPADSQTIPKLLRKAGYKSAAIGKWGLGYPGSEGDPIKQGFDHFFGYNCQRQAHTYYPPHLWRNDKKIMLEGNRRDPKTDYSHDLLTAEALNFIRDNRENPFFLHVPYTIPHAAFQVPELGQYAEKPWSPVKKAIAAMISRMDGDVGKILDLVKSLGLEENTLVIFASDNGSAGGALLNEFNGSGPLRASKGTLYEGGIRSPMIARWPGRITPGSTSAHICAFQDMMPTFAELAGVTVSGRTDGISIVPTLLGKGRQRRHEYLYWELKANRAVRMGNLKAVQTKAGLQLFDLSRDLSEKTDIAVENPDIVEKMRAIIRDSHEDSPFFTWEYTGPLPEESTAKKPKRKKSRNK
ncbi:MAG: arylsulfatase [Planctomycetota bacterium]